MVPLRLSVIATAIGLTSCSPSSDVSAEYSAPKVWNETFENYVDTDVFLDVTVNEESYDVFGRTFEDERSLGNFVRERAAYDTSMYDVPAQILVRSDAAVSRQRFRKALEVIEKTIRARGRICALQHTVWARVFSRQTSPRRLLMCQTPERTKAVRHQSRLYSRNVSFGVGC